MPRPNQLLRSVALHPQRDQQLVAGRGDAGAAHRDGERAVVRERLARELRLDQAVDLGERHVDRHRDADAALLALRRDLERRRERAFRLGLLRDDAGLGLDADQERDRLGIDPRLRRDRARRPKLEPEVRQPGAGGADRQRAAEFRPLPPRHPLEERIVAQPLLQPRDLLVDLPLQQRPHLVGHVQPHADDGHVGVGDGEMRGQVRLQPPGRRELRLRDHRDIAADIGALVEGAARELLDAASEVLAEDPADRATEAAGRRRGDLSGRAQRAGEHGRDADHIAACRTRRADRD